MPRFILLQERVNYSLLDHGIVTILYHGNQLLYPVAIYFFSHLFIMNPSSCGSFLDSAEMSPEISVKSPSRAFVATSICVNGPPPGLAQTHSAEMAVPARPLQRVAVAPGFSNILCSF